MALNPVVFGIADFGPRAERVFDEMRASKPLPGHTPVRLPGDGKTAVATARMEQGLDLKPALRRDLDALKAEYALDSSFI